MWFREMESSLPDEIARQVETDGAELADRGAVWAYLTTDHPSGDESVRSPADCRLRSRPI